MKNTNLARDAMSLFIIQQKLQQESAVLTPAERNIYIVKFLKYVLKALLHRLIYVHVQIFSLHLILQAFSISDIVI